MPRVVLIIYVIHNRHHVFMKIPPKQIQLAEVGPRFEMKRASASLVLTAPAAHTPYSSI